MSKNLGIKIEAEDKASGVIQNITSSLNKLKNNQNLQEWGKLGRSITGVAGAFGVAAKGIKMVGAALSDLSAASLVQQKAEITLAQAVKNNPYYDNSAAKRLKDYASQLQKTSTIGDETLIPLMSNLVNYGRSEAQVMDIMQTAVDMAESGVMSLDSAVSALNATYQGTTGSLGRQCSALKNLTKEELEAGKGVEVLKKQYAGAAEEISGSVGVVQKLKNSWGDFKEHLGNGVNAILSPLASAFGWIVDGVNNAIDGLKKSEIEVVGIKRTIESIPGVKKEGAGKTDYVKQSREEVNDNFAKASAEIRNNWKEAEENIEAAKKKMDELYKYRNMGFQDTGLSVAENTRNYENAKENYEIYKKWVDDKALYDNKALRSQSELGKLEQERNKRLTEINSNNKSAIKDLEKEYDKVIDAAKLEIEWRRKNGEIISEAVEQQQLYNKGEEFYIKALNEGNLENNYINEKLKERAELLKSAEAEERYKNEIKELKKRQDAQEKLNDTLSDEAKKREELEAKTKAYIALVAAGGGATATAKNALNDIKTLSNQVAQYDKLKGAVSDVEKEAENLIKTQKESLNIPLSQTIRDTIKVLDAEAEKLDKNSELYKKYVEERKKLQGLLSGVEGSEGKSFADGISINKNSIEEAVSAFEEIARLDVEYNKLSEEEKTKNAEIYSKKRRQILMGAIFQSFSTSEEYLSRFSETMSLFAQLAEQTASAEAQKQTAELEKAYANNEITEEEYYKQKEQIEKEAAEKSYKLQLAAWAVQLAQTIANTAAGITSAFATSGNIYAGIALAASVGALGAAHIATVAAQKPRKNFATGGIVGGNSYYGDKVQANVNSGEMILNRRQQSRLFDMINVGNGGPSGLNVSIKNYRGNDTAVKTSFDSGTLKIVVDRIVNEGLSSGDYNNSLRTAQNLQNGKRYVS